MTQCLKIVGGALLFSILCVPGSNASAGLKRVQLPMERLELKYGTTGIAASETTYTGVDFGYLAEGIFLDLINTRSTSASFAITFQNLPGTSASPASGSILPFSVHTVVIFTDRTNVAPGEYTGNIRVIYLPDDTIIIPLHYFVADTIFGAAFTPPQDSVLTSGTLVNFGQHVWFTLWSKNTGAVNWQVKNFSGTRISRNFNGTLGSKGVWEWEPADTVTIPNGSSTVTSIASFTPTGNPVTDDFFAVVYQTSGGLPASTRGDLNNDGFLTAIDIVLELNLVFLGQIPPAGAAEGDVNCDTQLTSVDVVMLLNKTFLNTGSLCS